MSSSEKKILIPCGLCALAVIAASVVCGLMKVRLFTPSQLVSMDVFLILLLSVVAMSFSLKLSLKQTLYSYKNIGLIGGILFAAILLIVLFAGQVSLFGQGSISHEDVYRLIVRFPRHFSYYALFVICAVSLLVGISNVALIRHEGFRPRNALSILIAAFYIGGTLLIYLISDLLTTYVFVPSGLALDPAFIILGTVIPLFFLLMLCYFECIFAGSVIMGWLAAHQVPSYDKDFIIILGCSIDKKGGLLPLLKGRVNRAVRFAWEQEIATGKPLKYVPSGGQGPNEVMSEGSAMELYLLSHGAEDYEVFAEKKSRNTLENFRFSKKIIDEQLPGARIAFATTNYHMLRSGILARKVGLDVQGIAGDTKWYFWPNGFIREFFGILSLSIRSHILTAILTAVLCVVIGLIGYFGGMI